MVAKTGTAMYLKFGATVLSGDYRTFEAEETGDVVDGSAGADTNRTYLTTLKDGTGSSTIVAQAGSTALWAACAPLTSGTLEWDEEGTTAGKPKHTCWAIVTSRKMATEYADLTVFDVAWQFSGAVADSTY